MHPNYRQRLACSPLLLCLACSGADLTGSSTKSNLHDGAVPGTPAPSLVAAPVSPAPASASAGGAVPAVPTQTAAAPTVPAIITDKTQLAALSGLWDGLGYLCYENDAGGQSHLITEPVQVIKIDIQGEQFIGTKVTGDSCVSAGNASFLGQVHAGSVSVKLNIAAPGATANFYGVPMTGTYSPTRIVLNADGAALIKQIILTPHQGSL